MQKLLPGLGKFFFLLDWLVGRLVGGLGVRGCGGEGAGL